jgi:hypothetical protein
MAGPFGVMMHCHCSMCRKHHGASFATFVSAPIEGFRWLSGQDAVVKYRSSENGLRFFCKHCGSVAPTPMPDLGLAFAPAGNLDGDIDAEKALHAFVGSKAPYYEITDSLPQHAAMPPEYGGGAGVPRPTVEPRAGMAEGSCLCGGVAYELKNPLRIYHCHCTRCRRGRSAAHATNIFVGFDDFAFKRGEDLIAQYKVPDAKFFTVAFCTRCGGGAPRVNRERGFVSVPAGTLDTDPGIRPIAHIYVGSKAPWFEITGDVPQYAEMPPGN